MAKTLLDGVNEVLKRAQVLDSDAGLLTTLQVDAQQTFIDLAIQVLNEIVDELYSIAQVSKPHQLAEDTITLADGDRDYELATDLVVLRREFLLIDESNNHHISILGSDGYRELVHMDLNQDDTGLPHVAAIRPTDGQLFMDRAPTSNEAGRIYKYRYDKELELVSATDEFPFGNTVFRAIIPAAAEMWKLNQHREFNDALLRSSFGRASRLFSQLPPRDSWGSEEVPRNNTDPMQQ